MTTNSTIRAEVLSIAREAATIDKRSAALDVRRTTVLLDYFVTAGLAVVRPGVTEGSVSDPAHYVLTDASVKGLSWAVLGQEFATHRKGKGFVLASESGVQVPAVNIKPEKRDALTEAEQEAWSSAHAWRKSAQRLAATLAPTVTEHGETSQTQAPTAPAPEAPEAPEAPQASQASEGGRLTSTLRDRAIREAGEEDAVAILTRMLREIREEGLRPDPALGVKCAEYAKIAGAISPRAEIRTPADA